MTDPVWLELLNKRLDLIDAQMDDVLRRLRKVEQIAFDVQAEKTTQKVAAWAKENLPDAP